jgi:hypothetical protein
VDRPPPTRSQDIVPRAGHGQGKPASKVVLEETDIWTFLLEQLRS